ncbi:MAG TPA: hypothetical protein DEQ09_01435 [Bacteroidales bacterium]|nr:hypothetical protein [Bacteroidales bacterium]
MKERIRIFLDKENKTSSQFAGEIGIQPSGVSHVLSGRNKPSLDFVIKMLNKYNDINTDWLLFGKGEMYRNEEYNSLFADKKNDTNDIEDHKIIESGKLFDIPGDIKSGEQNTISEHENNDSDTSMNKPLSERIIIFYPDGTYNEYNRRK